VIFAKHDLCVLMDIVGDKIVSALATENSRVRLVGMAETKAIDQFVKGCIDNPCQLIEGESISLEGCAAQPQALSGISLRPPEYKEVFTEAFLDDLKVWRDSLTKYQDGGLKVTPRGAAHQSLREILGRHPQAYLEALERFERGVEVVSHMRFSTDE
jgi:hypothetical protein